MNSTSTFDKEESNDSSNTGQNSGSYFADDTSPGIKAPARDQLEYRQWYVDESKENRGGFYALASLFDKQNSSVFSALILVFVALFSALGGFLAIRYLPEPKEVSFQVGSSWNKFKKLRPDQQGYISSLSFPVQMDLPCCMTVDSNGLIYVGGGKKIHVFSNQGLLLFSVPLNKELTCISVPGSEKLFSQSIIIGYNGGLVEAYHWVDQGNAKAGSTARRLEKSPFFSWMVPEKSGSSVLRKILATDQSLFVVDAGNKSIYEINAKSNVVRMINGDSVSDEDEAFPGFVIPALPFLDMVLSPTSGMLHITNPGKHRIETFTRDGIWRPELAWGTPSAYVDGFCGCCNPCGLEILADGNFATAEKFISRVKVCDPQGRLLTVVVGTDDLESPPLHLVNYEVRETNQSGNTDQNDANQGGISPKENTISFRPSLGDEHPIRIAVLPDQRIAVLDPTYAVVRIFEKKP